MLIDLPAKCISVKPFSAWAIIHGGKLVENRSRRTPYRGPLLIHASNYRSQDELEEDFAYVQRLCPSVPHTVDAGGIIGRVELVGSGDGSACIWAQPGMVHWLLASPEPLPFVECKGWLNVWTLKTL